MPDKTDHRAPYDPNAEPWNAGTPWSEMAVEDFKASIAHGETSLAELAVCISSAK
jgi:hypothetical protein